MDPNASSALPEVVRSHLEREAEVRRLTTLIEEAFTPGVTAPAVALATLRQIEAMLGELTALDQNSSKTLWRDWHLRMVQVQRTLGDLPAALAHFEEYHLLDRCLHTAHATAVLHALEVNSASQYMARLNHDLRTPLTAIQGFAELLLLEGGLTDEQRTMLETIQRNGDRMNHLIGQMGESVKLAAGAVMLQAEATHLGELLDDIYAEFEPRARAQDLQWTLDHTQLRDISVLVDGGRLAQALRNLIANAFDHTEVGEIRLTACTLDGAGASASQYAVEENETLTTFFVVEDTGRGIAPEHVEIMFAPLWRTPERPGQPRRRGMGLADARGIVTVLGGDIAVESIPDCGSIFWFRLELPVASPGAPAPAADSAPTYGASKGRTVLVVDDSTASRNLLRLQLEKAGFSVREAKHGEAALEAISDELPRLVLMDVIMPVMDGIEATTHIRRQYNAATLPIVVMSSQSGSDIARTARRAGGNEFLPKPIASRQLQTVINRYLR